MTFDADSKNPVIVLGAGGHARVVVDALRVAGRELLGITDPGAEANSLRYGLRVLGGDDIVERYSPQQVSLANGIGAMPGSDLRERLHVQMKDRGYRFTQVIHPSSVVAEEVELAEGVQIMAGVVIQPGVSLGAATIVNTGASVDHDCWIGDFCHLAPGVTLSGDVEVNRGTHIGTGAVVIEAVVIGRNCVVAAGATLYRDLADDSTYIPRSESDRNRR